VQRLLGLYRTATREQLADGAAWYRNAWRSCQEIARSYYERPDVVAAIVAILSPGNRWEQNLDDAATVLEYWAAYVERRIDVVDLDSVAVATYRKNTQKAYSLLFAIHDDETPSEKAIETWCRGPKVSAFYQCITGLDYVLCLDSHAINAWFGSRVAGVKLPGLRVREIERCREDYLRAAFLAKVPVSTFQAVIWLRHRERIQQGKIEGYVRLNKGVN
jgi:hypothetical protein